MTWAEHHAASERLAADAEIAMLRGEVTEAWALYSQAAKLEALALDDLDASKIRTASITAVSAVALHYKASELKSAEALAHRCLAGTAVEPFAVDELRGMLQAIWGEEVRRGSSMRFAPGEVLISVSGGTVVTGGAPLDLIVDKVQTLQSLFYRTAEWLQSLPHRARGPASAEIQAAYTPWLFQASPGSYQFSLVLEDQAQLSLFGREGPPAAVVASEFLRIVEASAESPGMELPKVVTNPEYRSTILKLTRNLTPAGKKDSRFNRLDIRRPGGRPVILVPDTRRTLNEAIQADAPQRTGPGRRETIRGLLRAVHLDEDWIEVSVESGSLKVRKVGEAVDDVIGPMVNHPVSVKVLIDSRGQHRFIDIERED